MGLRFRKSIKLLPGFKLNLGKTGMSVSMGMKGAHRTINTNGKVTDTFGIPGTGIFYSNSHKKDSNK